MEFTDWQIGAASKAVERNVGRQLSLLAGVVALPRVLRLYPTNHSRVKKQLRTVQRMLEEQVELLGDQLHWKIVEGKLHFNGVLIDQAQDLTREFIRLLRRRGLDGMILRKGVTIAQLRLFGGFLLSDPRLQDAPGREFVGAHGSSIELTLAGRHGIDTLELLRGFLAREEVQETLEELGKLVGTEHQSLEDFVGDVLERPEVAELPEKVLQSALEKFLRRLLDLLRTETLPAMTVEQSVEEILEESLAEAGAPQEEPETLVRELDRTGQHRLTVREVREARDEMRERFKQTPMERGAFVIHCEYFVAAQFQADVEHRRTLLMQAIGNGQYAPMAIVAGIQYLHEALPKDRRSWLREFVLELAGEAADAATVVAILSTVFGIKRHEATGVTEKLRTRSDAVAILASLIAEELMVSVRTAVFESLIRAAGTKPGAWLKWATENTGVLLAPTVWGLFMRRAPDLLAPVAKEIFTRGSLDDKRQLLKTLVANGRPRSLRLIVLTMKYGDEARFTESIEALGQFASNLAVAALREVVHRANTQATDMEEVAAAFNALAQSKAEDAEPFLHEVAYGRCMLLPAFRRPLRTLAREVLQDRRGR